MQCISPIELKRNHNKITGFFGDKVPCGKCYSCLRNRSGSWNFRLLQEAYNSSSIAFLTLTYEDSKIKYSEQGFPTLSKEDYQLFFKRLRKTTHNKLKYYACGEYGTETHRPHYHAIVFNLPHKFIHDPYNTVINKAWNNGNVVVAEGNPKTIHYVTGYIMKGKQMDIKQILDEDTGELQQDDRQKEFALISKAMGINFLTKQMVRHIKENMESYIDIHGIKTPLPRYYRDKIFTSSEKKIIAQKARIYIEENVCTPQQEIDAKNHIIRQHKKSLENRKKL